jgi:hypothetical protein
VFLQLGGVTTPHHKRPTCYMICDLPISIKEKIVLFAEDINMLEMAQEVF